ncbi:hypothetical protein U1Q18_037841, partial [Sarracenia purpurea var. burkii]
EENVEESLVVPPLGVPASDGSVGHKGSFVEDDVPVSEDKYGSSVAEKVPVAPISGGESNEIYDIEYNSEIGRSIIQGSDHVLGVCPAPVVNQVFTSILKCGGFYDRILDVASILIPSLDSAEFDVKIKWICSGFSVCLCWVSSLDTIKWVCSGFSVCLCWVLSLDTFEFGYVLSLDTFRVCSSFCSGFLVGRSDSMDIQDRIPAAFTGYAEVVCGLKDAIFKQVYLLAPWFGVADGVVEW